MKYAPPINALTKATEYKTFATKTAPKLAQVMVNEYNMKKRAFEAKNESFQKRGTVDLSRIAFYKTSDNIFSTKRITPDGMNHGLYLCIDWSASMHNDIERIAIQFLITTLFCKRAGIPFKVSIFTSRSMGTAAPQYSDSSMDKLSNMLIADDTMNEAQLRNIYYHMICYYNKRADGKEVTAMGNEYINWVTKLLYMSGTPLLEAAVDVYTHAYNMKKTLGIQSMNVMFITDGEPTSTGLIPSYRGRIPASSVVCPFTSRRFDLDLGNGRDSYNKLINNINSMYQSAGIRVMNIFISQQNSDPISLITKYHVGDNTQKLVNEISEKLRGKNSIVEQSGTLGYNKFWVVRRSLFPTISKNNTDEDDNDTKQLTDNEIRREFIKGAKSNIDIQSLCKLIVNEMCKDLK